MVSINASDDNIDSLSVYRERLANHLSVRCHLHNTGGSDVYIIVSACGLGARLRRDAVGELIKITGNHVKISRAAIVQPLTDIQVNKSSQRDGL